MRWVMVTRKLDPADDRAGFVMRWVETLAARVEHLDVVCQESANPPLPENVTAHSMGKETGAGRMAQAGRFTAHLRRTISRADGVFCHMIPRYVLFAAPWARLYRKPLLFWYTHRHASQELRLANRLADHILTAAEHSYPLPHPRRHVIGHGIDANLFPLAEGETEPPAIATVGRLSSVKRVDWLLRAATQIADQGTSPDFRIRIIGGQVDTEADYTVWLHELAAPLGEAVTFTGPLPHAKVAGELARCALAANLSQPGLFDKAALEPMCTGKPVLVTNADFVPLLGDHAERLYLPTDATDADLAERLAALLALSPEQRAAIGRDLRDRVLAAHALDGLMDRIVDLMRHA